ncbi:Redoxin-domain-containing protein [Suillus subalutaceus]|uniref:Redoxin-domain-containing protein n=1 Tax=Suillus subalutaceus TaxID=48586 RepID=UPI001B863AFE|nr:Redoxin-domain-containing protein [Suillus subalutaceus]KAG1871792.1 Redoxin-domain-containing protein [Suillus subalutaceus]
MASILTNVAQAAHSAAAAMLSAAQIEAGEPIPQKPVKEEDPERSITLDLSGKNIILGVPGAFTPPCSSQVPQYIADYDKFKAKGREKHLLAWKEKLAPQGTGVRFIADDKGEFTSSVGLLFDASGLLGSPRSKRYVIVTQDGKVDFIAVEEQPANITSTAANVVIAQL